MAVTRIWPIKGQIGAVIAYAADKRKTDEARYSDGERALLRSIHYAEDENKTMLQSEQKLLVEGINCDPEHAVQQMTDTKELYGKNGGIVAYHAYVSLKPDEVTAQQAQEIGMEIAKEMWGRDYEMIVSTHQNARCMHCHIVINSVSMTDGKKMNENKAMYNRFRETADRICFERGLSVIAHPKKKRVPYNVYMAQQKGIKTKYDYMKAAIDFAIRHSPDGRRFLQVMRDQGYFISNFGSPERYATIRSRTDEHGVRLANLGADYTPEAIRNRIRMQDRYELNGNIMRYNSYRRYFVNNMYVYRYKDIEFEESWRTYRSEEAFTKMAGTCVQGMLGGVIIGAPVISLLLLTLLFVGALIEVHDCNPHPMSPEMKLLRPKITFMQEQIDLAVNEKLYNYADVERFIADTSLKMEQLKFERSKVYNKIRGCKDPVKLAELVKQRDGMTAELARLRNKLKLAQRIIDDQPMLRGKVEAEKEQMREWYFPQRTLEQNKDRHRDDGAR
jgi:hypothetical protein